MVLTKRPEIYKLLRICPNPSNKQAIEIGEMVGVQQRTVYKALADFRKLNLEGQKNVKKSPGKKKGKKKANYKKPVKKKGGRKSIISQFTPADVKPLESFSKVNAFNMKKFIKTKNRLLTIPIKKLIQDFKEFVGYVDRNGTIHEGHAMPYPIDKHGVYLGILPHELKAFVKILKCLRKGIMLKWFRGAGKTYIVTWIAEWTMKRLGYPWIYLSETDVITDVAYWVFQWATRHAAIVHTIAGGKKNTYKGFDLANGAKWRIFTYLGEKMVGKHGWYLILDDIIKKKQENKPSEIKKSKMQWLYSIKWMNILGLIIAGTRKFEGDTIEFLEINVKDLTIDILVPYVMEGEFPNWKPIIGKDGHEIMSVPELYNWQELEDKKYTPTDDDQDPVKAFMTEMMQDPRVLEGGSWQEDDLIYITHYDTWDYEAACIAVDPAFTIGEDSAETGISVILLHKELAKYKNRQFLVIRSYGAKLKVQDWSEVNRFGKKVKHKGILTRIEELYQFIRVQIPGLRTIIVVIETNSGGDIIVQQIEYESDKYDFAGHVIEVKHNSQISKFNRIDKELYSPIKMGYMKFLDILKKSRLEMQILQFPNSKLIDELDSVGMGKDELNKVKRVSTANERRNRILADTQRRLEDNLNRKWSETMGIRSVRPEPSKQRSMF